MKLEINPTDDDTAIEIVDRIERRRLELRFPGRVSPAPADVDGYVYPVDRAVDVRTDRLAVEDATGTVTVFDAEGAVEAKPGTDSWTESIPAGTYYLNVADHVKTYLRVEAPEGITIERDDETSTVEIDFGRPIDVGIGARSASERPAATITTSPAPEDMMTAISYLGSALKDDGPMRSYPSLRGHPPEIELGDELDVPDGLQKPDAGIRLELPRSYEHAYIAAPLAYYLGATVEPGATPRLVTDDGFSFPLDGPNGYERTVERVLKQVFTCDCFVRSAGPYAYGLADLEEFLAETGLEPDRLYDRTPAARLESYLSVPYETVEPFVPHWEVGAHLEPVPNRVEYLPFLAADLAVVRTPTVQDTAESADAVSSAERALADGEFTRSTAAVAGTASGPSQPGESSEPTVGPATPESPDFTTPTMGGGSVTDGSSAPLSWPGSPPPVAVPAEMNTQEQLWIADGIPLGADDPTLEAYRHALDRDPIEGEIEIAVVCNDERMAAENEAVRELLAARTPFEVRLRPFRNLRTDELRELFARGVDFLHYIGHIDDTGFECPDGTLDVSTLEEVNVDAFFLNACSSYEQGRGLIEAGAIAGVVTLADVRNEVATETGQLIARLLNDGFPLNTALSVASQEHGIADQYAVVGDGRLQVTQSDGGVGLLYAESVDDGAVFDLRMRTFTTPQGAQGGLGSTRTTTIEDSDGWHLTGSEITARVSRAEFAQLLAHGDTPVYLDGEFGWSRDISLDEQDAAPGTADP